MAISSSQLVLIKSSVVSDAATNGGRIGTDLVSGGVKNNIFPDVPKSERASGSQKLRKLFYALRNPDSTAGLDAKVFVMKQTNANDAVMMLVGTPADTQADILPASRRYGAGVLAVAAAAGATSITVTPEQSNYAVYQVGDAIAITARNESDVTSPLDYYTILAVQDNASNKDITIDRGLDNAMAIGSTVSSCILVPTLRAEASGVVSTGGAVDGSKITLNNAGAIDAHWTLTFTSATDYTASCDAVSMSGITGNVSATFAPNNAGVGQAYFSIAPAFFVGTFSAGKTVSFDTDAANIPFWLERNIPAGTSYASANSLIIGFEVESE